KALEESKAISVRVIRIYFMIGSDNSAEVVAKCNADRRAVINGADAHLQNRARATRGLIGQTVGKVGMNLTCAQHTCPFSSNAEQISGFRPVDFQKRPEYRGNENRAAIMRFASFVQSPHIRRTRLPFLRRLIDSSK